MYALLLTALLPQAPADYLPQGGRALETFPLHGLLAPYSVPVPPPMQTFLEHREREPVFALYTGEMLDSDVLVELLASLHSEEHDSGLLQLDLQGETLLVAAEQRLTRAVGSDLSQLRAVLARPITVEASLYRLPRAESMPPVLTPGQRQSAVADLERVWHGSTRIQSGRIAELGAESWTDYLRSVEAEVAQEASIGRPVMDSLFEGLRLLVQPHALTGSEDLVLCCQVAFGQRREPIRLRSTGAADLPSLDVPLVDLNAGTFSGRIRSGGALALTSTGDPAAGSRLLLVVSARHEAPPASLSAADFRLFPVSALTSSSLRDRLGLPLPYPPVVEQDEVFEEEESERGYGSVDPDVLLDLVRSTRPEKFDDEAAVVFGCGSHLAVRADDDVLAAVEALLTGLQDRWLVNHAIELDTDLGGSSQRDGTRPWHALAIPALQGRRHYFQRGIETTALRDFGVAIAQDAKMLHPGVYSVFSGIAASFTTSAGDNGVLVELDCELTHVPEPQRRPLEVRTGGELYPAQLRLARYRHYGEMAAGRSLELGQGPEIDAGSTILPSRLRVEVLPTTR